MIFFKGVSLVFWTDSSKDLNIMKYSVFLNICSTSYFSYFAITIHFSLLICNEEGEPELIASKFSNLTWHFICLLNFFSDILGQCVKCDLAPSSNVQTLHSRLCPRDTAQLLSEWVAYISILSTVTLGRSLIRRCSYPRVTINNWGNSRSPDTVGIISD